MVKMAKIGAEIRARRVKERVSLEELAALTGIGINTLSRLERGVGNTQMKVLLKVLDAMGLEIEIKPKRILYR
ncbi:MAG: helix-turn-helix domain-containing protein [Akkermansia sp.]|nr:helix-turn-helix domain-containing protein [Akkermansia sp.]